MRHLPLVRGPDALVNVDCVIEDMTKDGHGLVPRRPRHHNKQNQAPYGALHRRVACNHPWRTISRRIIVAYLRMVLAASTTRHQRKTMLAALPWRQTTRAVAWCDIGVSEYADVSLYRRHSYRSRYRARRAAGW